MTNITRLFFALIVLLLWINSAWAQNSNNLELEVVRPYKLSDYNLYNGKQFRFWDGTYAQGQYQLGIALRYRQGLSTIQEEEWSYSLDFDLKEDKNGEVTDLGSYTLSVSNNISQSLIIPKDENGTPNIIEYHNDFVSQSSRFIVEIIGVSDHLPEEMLENLYLEGRIYRDYQLQDTQTLDIAHSTVLDDSDNSYYQINWGYREGIAAYDLEWVFVDSREQEVDEQELFANGEAVRVRVSQQYYRIPKSYAKGKIYYRLRGVGKHKDNENQPVVGSWTTPVSISVAEGIQEDMVWQTITSYAEDGKQKQVVSYYDGSMRNRQSVTNLSTEGKVMIAEAFYDEVGRANLTVLPAPAEDNTLNYHTDFNVLNADGTLQANSGAGNYYSQDNLDPFKPHANGKFYTETVYKNDNTGRVREQGGLGEAFQIGGEHTTRYYYTTPSKEELARLFGEDNLGKISFYQKQVVIDPNGQISLSYLDGQGRVIATALSGDAPKALDAISTVPPSPLVVDLSAANEIISENKVTSLAKIFNENVGTAHQIRFTFTGSSTTIGEECTNCEYDLEVYVYDPDGYEIEHKVYPVDKATCTDDSPFNTSFSFTAEKVGEYTIKKNIEVMEGGMSWSTYRDEYLTAHASEQVLTQTEENALIENCTYPIVTEGIDDYSGIVQELYASSCDRILNKLKEDAEKKGIEVEYHPEYCHYLNCLQEATDTYEEKQKLTKVGLTWESGASGFGVRTASASVEDVVDAIIANDQYFAGGRGKDPYGEQRDILPTGEMYKRLFTMYTYGEEEYTLEEMLSYNPNVGVVGTVEGEEVLLLYEGLTTETEKSERKWQLLAQQYIKAKQAIKDEVNAYLASCEEGCACSYVEGGVIEKPISTPEWDPVTGMSSPEQMRQQVEKDINEKISSEIDLAKIKAGLDEPLYPFDELQGFQSLEDWSFVRDSLVADSLMVEENCEEKTITLEQSEQLLKLDGQSIIEAEDFNFNLEKGFTFTAHVDWDESESESQKRYPIFYTPQLGLYIEKTASNIKQLVFRYGSYTTTVPITQSAESNCGHQVAISAKTLLNTEYLKVDFYWDGALLASKKLGARYLFREGLYNRGIKIGGGRSAIEEEDDTPIKTYDGSYTWEPSNYEKEAFQMQVDYFTSGLRKDANGKYYVYKGEPFNVSATISRVSTTECVEDRIVLQEDPMRTKDNVQGTVLYGATTTVNNGYIFGTPTKETGIYSVEVDLNCGCLVTYGGDENWGYIRLHRGSEKTQELIQVEVKERPLTVGDEMFIGSIKDIKVWNAPLSKSQLFYAAFQHAEAELPMKEELLAIWRANEGSNRRINNLVRSGVDASIMGSVNWIENPCKDTGSMTYTTCDYSISPALQADFERLNTLKEENCQEETRMTLLSQKRDKVREDAFQEYQQNKANHCLYSIEEEKKKFTFKETFTDTYNSSIYHYTLYYYDQAGNLVQTVPPEGVNLDDNSGNHSLFTQYRYNTLNQIVWQSSPDGGITEFAYDSKGRLRFSQNAQQKLEGKFSYTRYDALGRVIESGEARDTTLEASDLIDELLEYVDIPEYPQKEETELTTITHTNYDSYISNEYQSLAVNKVLSSTTLPEQTLVQQDIRVEGTSSVRRGETVTLTAGNSIVLLPGFTAVEGSYFTAEIEEEILPNRPLISSMSPNAEKMNFDDNNLRGRVAWVERLATEEAEPVLTLYAYDIHGNVRHLAQQLPGLEARHITYDYDLISGNVNEVTYQPGSYDMLKHRYSYDADNRITQVETSRDGYIWQTDATYEYYLHGPLKRIELGHQKVQGLDYYYTLQGWIKGVNQPKGVTAVLGKDGEVNGEHTMIPSDQLAYMLGYYDGDYEAAGGSILANQTDLWNKSASILNGEKGLYNGNISWMVTDLPFLDKLQETTNKSANAMLYKYDQLHRIKEAQSAGSYTDAVSQEVGSLSNNLKSSYTYDANGNLQTLERHNNEGDLDNDLEYIYDQTKKNRLLQVKNSGAEVVTKIPAFASQDAGQNKKLGVANQDAYNYHYDAIGNLIADKSERLRIYWNVDGKVARTEKYETADALFDGNGQVITSTNTDELLATTTYIYDASGNRISKEVSAGEQTTLTQYVRDASGNVMAIYQDDDLKELPLYGSSRLGIYRPDSTTNVLKVGEKYYELSNHLGNVLATVTDKKTYNGEMFEAEVASLSDYYPFGQQIQARSFTTDAYRYGFNGKEKTSEILEGSYDFGARIYDARIGRWWSVDPEKARAPDLTPYRFGFNNPIRYLDPDGKWETDGHYWTVYLIALMLEIPNAAEIAYYAELPDSEMHADYAWMNYSWASPFHQEQTHALTGSSDRFLEQSITASSLRVVGYGNNKEFGRLLHRYGDTYAHSRMDGSGMYGKKINLSDSKFSLPYTDEHKSVHGPRPDYIYERPELYKEYVEALHYELSNNHSYRLGALAWRQAFAKWENGGKQIFDRLLSYASENQVSLIGIINYEVANYKKENSFMVHYIQHTPNSWIFPIGFAGDGTETFTPHLEHIENTEKYLKSKGVSYSTEKIYKDTAQHGKIYTGTKFHIK
ncbi:RHS repeat-associated core domain-containing protein [Algivirga pacifica]|uniref:DUF6443 domain-containing protein n=1 Tax=Algivirga pacifica TaxID=1162670 RepID=A0ABP9DM98_9BACT